MNQTEMSFSISFSDAFVHFRKDSFKHPTASWTSFFVPKKASTNVLVPVIMYLRNTESLKGRVLKEFAERLVLSFSREKVQQRLRLNLLACSPGMQSDV